MKKLRLILSLICLLSIGLFSSTAIAQISKGGLPPSFSLKKGHILKKKAQLEIPVNFSIKELLEEDEFNAQNAITVPRVAVKIPVDISMENSGEWYALPGEKEKRLWRVAVEAKDAKAIILSYNDFYLPAGSQLFIYNKDKTHVLGAFDNSTNPRGGIFSTNFVAGDLVNLEYIAPATPSGDKARINISGVGYAYNHIQVVPQVLETRSPKLPVGKSNPCQVNIVCSPEGDLWKENSKSVCQMLMLNKNSWGFCTGTLINNTANNMDPYIISAFHCYEGATEDNLLEWQFNFFYKSTECKENKDAYKDMQTLVGCTLMAQTPMNGGSDGLLLKLTQTIPGEWVATNKIRWAGWDRREKPNIMAKRGVGIHHPKGDVQKISTYNSPATIVGNLPFGPGIITAPNAHFSIFFDRTDNGFSSTEGGSSGSGLLNQYGLLIGSLSGGPDGFDCSDKTANKNLSFYGTMAYHWDKHGNSPETQMKTWLDPIGGGKAETCEWFPNLSIVMDFTGSPRELYAAKTVSFSAVARNADSIRWHFEGGSPETTTEINPRITYNKEGEFNVKLTAYTKNPKGKNIVLVEEKEKYIKVNFKGIPGELTANVATLAPMEGSSDIDNFNDPDINNIYIKENNNNNNNWQISEGPINNLPIHSGYDGIGDKCAWFKAKPKSSALIYKTIKIANYDKPILSFKYLIREVKSYYNAVDNLQVKYRENASAEWELLYDAQSKATCQNNEDDVWASASLLLPKTDSPDAQIAFVGIMSGANGIAIDDVHVYNAGPADGVRVWKGETARFYDFSKGNAVLYQYTFAGGDPETSKTEKESIDVQYNKEGKYDISQWVKNTINEDTITHKNYVTVMVRDIKTDKHELEQACGAAFEDEIILTTNSDWTATAPDWVTLDPKRGYVKTPGDKQDITVKVKVTANPNTKEGRSGYINFSTENGILSSLVQVTQPTLAPPKIRIDSTKSSDIYLSWTPAPGTWTHPCDITNYGGGFEDPTLYSTHWKSISKADVDPDENPEGWKRVKAPASAQEKDSYMQSISHDPMSFFMSHFKADNWLITPQLKPNNNNKVLSFWIASDSQNKLEEYEVWLSTAETINSTDDFTVKLLEPITAAYNWEEKTITIPDQYLNKNVYIAFRHIVENKFILKLDNVSGIPLANCENTPNTQSLTPQMLSSKNTIISPISNVKTEEISANNDQKLLEQLRKHDFAKNLVMHTASNSSQLSTQSAKSQADVSNLNEFRWCSELETARGLDAAGAEISIAAKWSAEDLKQIQGSKIKAIEIGLIKDAAIELFILDGTIELYKQRIPLGTLNIGKPSIIELDRPVNILGLKEIYIGYTILEGSSGGPIGTDKGPRADGKGNLLYLSAEKEWVKISLFNPKFNENWYIIAYGEGGGGEGYSLYRKRANDTDGDYQFVAAGITDTTFVDKNVKPGGEVCYQVRYRSNGAESCPSEENDCATIIYSQDIKAPKLIEKTYGDPNFTLGFADNSDIKLRSSIESIDNFKLGDFPVTLAIEGGTSDVIDLEGKPGNYSIKIKKIGEVKLIATQSGINKKLLAAESTSIDIKIKPTKLTLTAKDMEREEGEENPVFECIAEGIAYEEKVSNLQVQPKYTCFAKANSPAGEYEIDIFAQDPNYEIECKPGKLTVKHSSRTDVNIFTPYSADGYNDYFMAGHNIKVFNRQGILIYETSNTQELSLGWNGKISKTNKMAEPGVYYYVVVDDKGKTINNGSVTLVK